MIKLFITIFFIAELIIAFALILNIYKFNRSINLWNKKIIKIKPRIRTTFLDFKYLMVDIREKISNLKELAQEKKKKYIVKIMKSAFIFGSFSALQKKYKKTILAYYVGRGFYEGLVEGLSI